MFSHPCFGDQLYILAIRPWQSNLLALDKKLSTLKELSTSVLDLFSETIIAKVFPSGWVIQVTNSKVVIADFKKEQRSLFSADLASLGLLTLGESSQIVADVDRSCSVIVIGQYSRRKSIISAFWINQSADPISILRLPNEITLENQSLCLIKLFHMYVFFYFRLNEFLM